MGRADGRDDARVVGLSIVPRCNRITRLLPTVAIVLMCSCDLGTQPDILSYHSRIEGLVLAPDRAGVAGARVDIWRLFNTSQGGKYNCVGFQDAPPTQVVTDDVGAFSLDLTTNNLEPVRCVEVTATPPTGSGLSSQVDTVFMSWSRSRGDAPTIEVSIVLHSVVATSAAARPSETRRTLTAERVSRPRVSDRRLKRLEDPVGALHPNLENGE
jgi:hypothetical protein